VVNVLGIEKAGRGPLEHGEVEFAVVVEVGHRHGEHRAVEVLANEDQVEDANDAPIDQIDQERHPLAGHAAARKLDDYVVNRAHRI